MDTKDDELIAQLEAGISAADEQEAPSEPEVTEEAAEEPQEESTEETPEEAHDEGKGPAEPEKLEQAKPDEVEAEIKGFNLKEKAAERFRHMSEEIKTARQALESAGIKDFSELPKIVERAQIGTELVSRIMDTGAPPQMFDRVLDYTGHVNAAVNGNMESARIAFDVVESEYQMLAKMLGKEIPGVHDPLAEHADLLEDVENGDITRKRALEIAQARSGQRLTQAREQQTQAQQSQQAQVQQATDGLAQLDAMLRANDPVYVSHRREQLSARVAEIKRTLPPSQWVEATQLVYRTLASVPVQAPKPVPSVGPVRAVRSPPAVVPTFKNELEALEYGLKQAG